MASQTPIGLEALPNEIITSILTLFPTRTLLPLTILSHRIHALILRLIHTRILAATSLPSHKVILECYHPSAKLITPYFFCEYLGTDPFSLSPTSSSTSNQTLQKTGKLAELRDLYCHFRPIQPEGDRKVWRPRPSGGWQAARIGEVRDVGDEWVCQDVYLESHELFSQLQSVVNVVKIGPKKDLFLSCVTIGEGLTRVWRDWLAEHAAENGRLNDLGGKVEEKDDEYRKKLLWSSLDEHIGLKLRVIPREDVRAPILLESDEDPNVGYTLQYEELVVRSTQLLLMIEQSLNREVSNSGKAIVIVS